MTKNTETFKKTIERQQIYKGIDWVICKVSKTFGWWYTAYIKIDPKYVNEYWIENIDCHGDITFKGDDLSITDSTDLIGTWIGWDYAHGGDYIHDEDYWKSIGMFHKDDGYEWTLDQVIKDCYKAIDSYLALLLENEKVINNGIYTKTDKKKD